MPETFDRRAEGFRFAGGHRGCLLLHGFTGTPCEMRPVGERLAELGYSVIAPRLPGHGTRVEELAATGWEDWFACALDAWDELGRVAPVRVAVGLSMGALLVLHLAHERPREVRAMALLATAIRLRNQRSAEQSLWLSRLPFLPRRLAIVRKENGARRTTPAYEEIPVRALASMIRLQRTVLDELHRIRVPALIVNGGRDLTVWPESGAAIEAALGGERKRRLVFPESGHILTDDVEASDVVAAVERFFGEVLAGGKTASG